MGLNGGDTEWSSTDLTMNTTNTEQEMSPTDRTEMKPSADESPIQRLIEQLAKEVDRENCYQRALIKSMIEEKRDVLSELRHGGYRRS